VIIETEEMDMTNHLNALQLRLSHERGYLAQAKTNNERALRKVWIAQIEKEIAAETKFTSETDCNLTDDELLAELSK